MSGNEERPQILITNDDGIHAKGISALAEAVADLGELIVVAPDRNRSAVSHAISLSTPLRCQSVKPGWWSVDGTPADCVYLALHQLLERRPSVVLSGVNAGPNLSYDVHYSGTVAGAREGTLHGVPGIAVSLVDPRNGSFEVAARFTRALTEKVLSTGLPSTTILNVNVPGGTPKSHQMTFLGHRRYQHSVEKRDDPRGRPYYWIGGAPVSPGMMPGSDCNVVLDGVISVTPLTVDVTDSFNLGRDLGRLEVFGSELVHRVDPPAGLERKLPL